MDIKPEMLRGFDLDLPAILNLFPPEKVIETIGVEKFIETIGVEKILQHFSTSDSVKLLASTLSEQQREKLIERLMRPDGDGN